MLDPEANSWMLPLDGEVAGDEYWMQQYIFSHGLKARMRYEYTPIYDNVQEGWTKHFSSMKASDLAHTANNLEIPTSPKRCNKAELVTLLSSYWRDRIDRLTSRKKELV